MMSQKEKHVPWRQEGDPQEVQKDTVWGQADTTPLAKVSQGKLKKSLRNVFETEHARLEKENNEQRKERACIEKQIADLKEKYLFDMTQANLGIVKGIYKAEDAARKYAARQPDTKNSTQGADVIALIRKGMCGDTKTPATSTPWQPRRRQQSTTLPSEATSSSPSDAATVRTSASSAFG